MNWGLGQDPVTEGPALTESFDVLPGSGDSGILAPSGSGMVSCDGLNLPAGFVGPVNCAPGTGSPNYAPSASQLAELSQQVQQLQQQASKIPVSVWLVGAGLVAFLLFGSGGRRR